MRTTGLAADSEEKTGTLLDFPNPSPIPSLIPLTIPIFDLHYIVSALATLRPLRA